MRQPDHVATNRAAWDRWARDYEGPGQRDWADNEVRWGIFGVGDDQLGVLGALDGLDTVELGCGTGYISAWLARRGARPIGVDNSGAQLATAARLQSEFDLRFPLIHADAEAVPLADGVCDLVISEYGASLWCDPYRWIPEAARLLRPGGQLTFLVNSALLTLCFPDSDAEGPATATMRRDYFGMYRFEWPDEVRSVEFHLGHGDWVRLLRRCGFEVDDLIEIQPGVGAVTRYPFVTTQWARRWPAEEIWKATKR